MRSDRLGLVRGGRQVMRPLTLLRPSQTLNLSQHGSSLLLVASLREQESNMKWTSESRGWWEAQGTTYRYRAVQRNSRSWDLMVFGQGLEATATYPATLSDCKHYAEYLESGKYEIRGGSLRKVAV